MLKNWFQRAEKVEISRLLLLGAFCLITGFVIEHWSIQVSDPYALIAAFVLLIAIPLLSKFDVLQYKDFTLRRSVEDSIEPASKQDLKELKKEEIADAAASTANIVTSDVATLPTERPSSLRYRERRRLEEKVLQHYSKNRLFAEEVRLRLEQPDPIANINHLVFDASYRDRKRRYFILAKASLGPFIADRVYRNLRIIKDISDELYHNKIILKIAYIQLEEGGSHRIDDLDMFRRHFSRAIESGYLEIDLFDSEGNPVRTGNDSSVQQQENQEQRELI